MALFVIIWLYMGIIGLMEFGLMEFGLLLGATTGAALNLIGGTRCLAYSRAKPSQRIIWIPLVFLSIALVATVLTWHGPVSLLALGGNLSGTIAFWHRKPAAIRRWALMAPPLWFTYNAISGSYPGMFIEIVMLSSNLIGEYRFDFNHHRRLQQRLARPA